MQLIFVWSLTCVRGQRFSRLCKEFNLCQRIALYKSLLLLLLLTLFVIFPLEHTAHHYIKKLSTRNQSPTKSRTPTERQARAQELCDSRGGRPGLPYLILISLRFLWTTLNQPETGQNQSRCRHTHTHLSDGAFSLQTILSGRHVRFSE